jgi:hypothetical protein
MKDETAENIANELRLIREELQKLTSAVKSIASRSQTSNKPGRSYQGRTPCHLSPDHRTENRKRFDAQKTSAVNGTFRETRNDFTDIVNLCIPCRLTGRNGVRFHMTIMRFTDLAIPGHVQADNR